MSRSAVCSNRLPLAPPGGTPTTVARRLLPAVAFCLCGLLAAPVPAAAQDVAADKAIRLPAARHDGHVSVEEALTERRSVRSYGPGALTIEELSQLLWSAQGVTERISEPPPGFRFRWMGGHRTAPSAGALYPLELYAVVGDVEHLDPGLYHYEPVEHSLRRLSTGDLRPAVGDAAVRQQAIYTAPASLVIAGVVERTAVKYKERARRYVHMEVGAAAQNIYLQAESLELGTVLIGAFDDREMKEALSLPEDQEVFAVMPVGRRAED